MASKESRMWSLKFTVVAECSTSRARTGFLQLVHSSLNTPVFMPVGTQGTLKGLLPEQVKELGCKLMLGNTYHLGHRPGHLIVKQARGLHEFMNWDQSLLTDSGGFQMVSLSELMSVSEEGVHFRSPHTAEMMLLTPEHSIEIQNALGADIAMQLDDVVHSSTRGSRVEEAMERSIRWLDRCVAAHDRWEDQNLFGIVQGGLDEDLRQRCALEMTKRNLPGFAIGGLSGGEEKSEFWRMVLLSTKHLPNEKPRYLMGVGWAEDMIVSVALGVDMFDCVFPTRTARFGCALIAGGQLNLKAKEFKEDFRPIDANCPCRTCKSYTRSYLNMVVTHETTGSHLLTVHNLTYQMKLMEGVRQAILHDKFPHFVRTFMSEYYPHGNYPEWIIEALAAVNIKL